MGRGRSNVIYVAAVVYSSLLLFLTAQKIDAIF